MRFNISEISATIPHTRLGSPLQGRIAGMLVPRFHLDTPARSVYTYTISIRFHSAQQRRAIQQPLNVTLDIGPLDPACKNAGNYRDRVNSQLCGNVRPPI